MKRSQEYLTRLVHELISMQNESGWFEFKHNNDDPDTIGQYISALSNTAALEGVNNAYIIWGINDTTHKIEGTSFKPHKSKEALETVLQNRETIYNEYFRLIDLISITKNSIDFFVYDFTKDSLDDVFTFLETCNG